MEVLTNEMCPQGSTEWLSLREGAITGTKLGKYFAKDRKAEFGFDLGKPNLIFYETLAERLTVGSGDDGEESEGLGSSRERGHDLEPIAIDEAEFRLGKTFIRGGVWRFSNSHLCSPDGYTEDLTEAIEIKCLSSARHIKAILENEAPSEYFAQFMNYFNNPKLERLYVALYDPRFIDERYQLKIFTYERKDWEEEIQTAQELAEAINERLNDYIEHISNGDYLD